MADSAREGWDSNVDCVQSVGQNSSRSIQEARLRKIVRLLLRQFSIVFQAVNLISASRRSDVEPANAERHVGC